MLPHRPQLLTGLEMFMRPAHFLSPVFLAAAVAAAFPVGAQMPFTASAASAAAVTDNVTSAAPAPVHVPLPASGELATPSTDWHSAHTAVGAFPRGHADIVAWEAAQTHGGGKAAPNSAAHSSHHGMASHKSPQRASPSHAGGRP